MRRNTPQITLDEVVFTTNSECIYIWFCQFKFIYLIRLMWCDVWSVYTWYGVVSCVFAIMRRCEIIYFFNLSWPPWRCVAFEPRIYLVRTLYGDSCDGQNFVIIVVKKMLNKDFFSNSITMIWQIKHIPNSNCIKWWNNNDVVFVKFIYDEFGQ